MTMMKRLAALVLVLAMLLTLAACGGDNTDGNDAQSGGSTLVYGSGDYTRINPAMDEHGEINVLLFDGLTDHDGDGQVIPRLAERWDYDPNTLTYTFYLAQGVTWHDGQPFTAEDVKFTYEAIMDPDNGLRERPQLRGCDRYHHHRRPHGVLYPVRRQHGVSGVHDHGHPASASAGGGEYADLRFLPGSGGHRAL